MEKYIVLPKHYIYIIVISASRYSIHMFVKYMSERWPVRWLEKVNASGDLSKGTLVTLRRHSLAVLSCRVSL